MNDNDLLKKQLESAPAEIRKFVIEKKWVLALEDITKKDSFSPEQKTALENEVLFVLIGLDLLSNLEINLITNLNIEPVLAKAISTELKEKVFEEIKLFLPLESEPEESQSITETQIQENPSSNQTTAIEIPPVNLPMIEPGEMVHDIPHVDSPSSTTPPTPPLSKGRADSESGRGDLSKVGENKTSYNGQDPYREPLI